MKRLLSIVGFVLLFFGSVTSVFAHESYVLTKQQMSQGLADRNLHVFDALKDSENMGIAVMVGMGIAVLAIGYFFFQQSRIGKTIDETIQKLHPFGHVLLRIALAASILFSAYTQTFLGPDIPIASLFFPSLLVPALYILGVLLLCGLWTRVVSAVLLVILLAATEVYGAYMLNYFNYFGELITLVMLGSYVLPTSKSRLVSAHLAKKYQDIEVLLIRVTYGISILYPAIVIKLLHPRVVVDIVNEYHLNQIHWLFPQDPLLISLGTGMAQILVGVMIIVGFETRLASIATFFLYLLSVLYFKEAVWPHYILLASAGYLMINNGGALTVDRYIRNKVDNTTRRQKKRKK